MPATCATACPPAAADGFPQRIVCLTEETTETLYLLGEEHRIVGISGFTVRPARARKEKPRVSAFTSAKIDRILELRPDLVLGFSDLQADIAAQLARAGLEVHLFNQRSVAEIFRMIRTLGGMIGCEARTAELRRAPARTALIAARARAQRPAAPAARVLRGMGRAADLRHPLGLGADRHRRRRRLFPRARAPSRSAVSASSPMRGEVPRRAPDIILGSWCGKKFRPEEVAARPGWSAIPAVRSGFVREIKSAIILQPGPAALTDGLRGASGVIEEMV